LAGKSRCAGRRLDDRRAVGQRVDKIITIIIDTVADLGIAVRYADVAVAGIADTINICVFLAAIHNLGAIITRITDTVFVLVGLVRVGDVGTVIIDTAESIIIGIEADTAQ